MTYQTQIEDWRAGRLAALKGKHAAVLDMAKAGPMVKARLGG